MRYMGDQPLKKGQTLTDCVYELLMICHRHPPMRDELYCQIMRQTTNNKSQRAESAIRGWRLFSIMTAYFDCSEVLKPYLMKYLSEAAGDTRRAYHGYFDFFFHLVKVANVPFQVPLSYATKTSRKRSNTAVVNSSSERRKSKPPRSD